MPDRTADAVLPWLRSHREITLVSRDRASAYADAISRALPHAIQVADRYHLIQNLREHLQRLFDHKRTCLPLVEDRSPTGGQPSAPDNSGAAPPGKAPVLSPRVRKPRSVTSLLRLSSSKSQEGTAQRRRSSLA